MNQKIFNEIVAYCGIENILFVNIQGLESGSDFDAYCVVKESVKSYVKVCKIDDKWVEIFIDNWIDMSTKISNNDEICCSFIKDIPNYYDVLGMHAAAQKAIPEKYALSQERKNLIYYRIKVLFSKYSSVKTDIEKNYFKGIIMPNIFILAFDSAGVWPKSPKVWLTQLYDMHNDYASCVIEAFGNIEQFERISEQEANKFAGLDVIKESYNNKYTFLG